MAYEEKGNIFLKRDGKPIAPMMGKCLICYRNHIFEIVEEGMAEIQRNPERRGN